MKYRLFRRQIIPLFVMAMVLFAFDLQAQVISIRGKVVGADNSPLPGVSVVVKGTTTGITTDMDGNFTLKIPSNSRVLLFSFIGMQAQEVPIAGKSTFNITMKEETLGLDEVVVVGYGTQKKRDITGAITSIDNKMIEKRQAVNVYDALQGEASGVLVVSNSGAPGDDNTIRIRGTSTFEGGVNPLYIVDGVPLSDISSVNPNDIQSMEILKDAASAAIYGSRSANGVIIITTKTGEAGKAKIDVRYL